MSNDSLDVIDWIEKAIGDYYSAGILAASDNPYVLPSACFHCQQSVEKIFKAYIIAKEGSFLKKHNLDELLSQCERQSSDFGKFIPACQVLNTYEGTTRYPSGKRYSKSDIEWALKDAYEILEFTTLKLKDLGYEFQTVADS
jgi:HEPN domain-containing protein